MSNTCNIGAGGGVLQPGQQCAITVNTNFIGSGEGNLTITLDAVGSPAVIGLGFQPKGNGGGR